MVLDLDVGQGLRLGPPCPPALLSVSHDTMNRASDSGPLADVGLLLSLLMSRSEIGHSLSLREEPGISLTLGRRNLISFRIQLSGGRDGAVLPPLACLGAFAPVRAVPQPNAHRKPRDWIPVCRTAPCPTALIGVN